MTGRLLTDADVDAVLHADSLADPELGALATTVASLRDDLTPTSVRPSAELAAWFDGTAVVAPVPSGRRLSAGPSRLAVKVALGAAVAVAGLGGAAVAGVLPDPVQHLYDGLVHRGGRGDTGPTGDARSGDPDPAAPVTSGEPAGPPPEQAVEPEQTISHQPQPAAGAPVIPDDGDDPEGPTRDDGRSDDDSSDGPRDDDSGSGSKDDAGTDDSGDGTDGDGTTDDGTTDASTDDGSTDQSDDGESATPSPQPEEPDGSYAPGTEPAED